eukprot:9427923-Pyramimonas_sp.AAC.1
MLAAACFGHQSSVLRPPFPVRGGLAGSYIKLARCGNAAFISDTQHPDCSVARARLRFVRCLARAR